MKAWILLMLALTLPMAAQAEEAKEGEAPKVSYYSLNPPFVGNYGLDGTTKLKVFKADIALRVTGPEALAAVKANEPLIRNQLVGLFTQQTNEAMSTVEGKEKLRQQARSSPLRSQAFAKPGQCHRKKHQANRRQREQIRPHHTHARIPEQNRGAQAHKVGRRRALHHPL